MPSRPHPLSRLQLPLLLLVLGCPLASFAEMRVLLAFDSAGQRVHSVTRSGSRDANLTSHVAPPADPAAPVRAGEAALLWLTADGRTLSLEGVPDPRIGHAPAPGGDGVTISPGTPVALAEGGWLVRGPDEATTLVVRLPAVGAPALAAEEWRLELDGVSVPGRQ